MSGKERESPPLLPNNSSGPSEGFLGPLSIDDLERIANEEVDGFELLGKRLEGWQKNRFKESFPDLATGLVLVLEKSSQMAERFGLNPFDIKVPFYDKIRDALQEDDSNIAQGGIENLLFLPEDVPQEQSYEYLGEFVTRRFREIINTENDAEDLSRKTGAFFGWIGRHVMKEIYPQTDFSLHRHREGAAKEKKEVLDFLQQQCLDLEAAMGRITKLPDCYKFFREEITIPGLDSAESTLWYRAGWIMVKKMTETPRPSDPRFGRKGDFEFFWEKWQEGREVKNDNYVDYFKNWEERHRDVFSDWLDHPQDFTREELIPKWFTMRCKEITEDFEAAIEDIENFRLTYFRFISDPAIAEGYACAQAKIEEILANLPEVIRMSEGEIYQQFFTEAPQILGAEDDYGENDGGHLVFGSERAAYRPLSARLPDFDSPFLTRLETAKTQEEHAFYKGPSSRLYEKLKELKLTPDQWALVIYPIFFGLHLVGDHYPAHNKEEPGIEQARLDLIRKGRLSLPQEPEDLLTLLDEQIERATNLRSAALPLRLEFLKEKRNTAIETKAIIAKAINRGILE